jgi:YrbI family 3-deoxy-D-manno-octulosonate 8-phosphate phosphatase
VVSVAIIPARGGSKGIIDKNLQSVHGVPLVVRAIRSCLDAVSIDQVFVTTDSERIASIAESHGARVIRRPNDLASDESSSEDALLHALRDIPDATTVAFVQCTSPFIDPRDIDRAVALVADGSFDSVFSGLPDHSFRWEETADGWHPVGHDMAERPRRQDLPPRVIETGAFYVFTSDGFQAAGSRFHGRVGVVAVSPGHAIEIDTADDLQIARELNPRVDRREAPWPLHAIVFDFDGVHTNDYVSVNQDGVETVTVKRGDGLGIGLLRDAGIPMLILSTETNPVVTARAHKLGVEAITGEKDKAAALSQWLEKNSYDPMRVAYVGNDVNDRGCFTMVGWPIAVKDAHPDVKLLARITLESAGGQGAVREVADLVLEARAKDASYE